MDFRKSRRDGADAGEEMGGSRRREGMETHVDCALADDEVISDAE